jgi:DNA (cytosine-5)-methyltransferase 1
MTRKENLSVLRSSLKTGEYDGVDIIHSELITRRYSTRECMRLQTIPEHHIDMLLDAGISNSQLYKMTGNSWTLAVIVHILKSIKG